MKNNRSAILTVLHFTIILKYIVTIAVTVVAVRPVELMLQLENYRINLQSLQLGCSTSLELIIISNQMILSAINKENNES